jgi:hypothetical protein
MKSVSKRVIHGIVVGVVGGFIVVGVVEWFIVVGVVEWFV